RGSSPGSAGRGAGVRGRNDSITSSVSGGRAGRDLWVRLGGRSDSNSGGGAGVARPRRGLGSSNSPKGGRSRSSRRGDQDVGSESSASMARRISMCGGSSRAGGGGGGAGAGGGGGGAKDRGGGGGASQSSTSPSPNRRSVRS